MINGAAGWDDMSDFAQARTAWLRGFLELPGGIPCADTFRRVFEAIDTRALAECLARITSDLTTDIAGKSVAIDGKTMRRTFDRRSGKSALHMVTAWVVEGSISLGQIATEEKSNEITAIPELLKTIDVRGATVSIDAMGCQKTIAAAIIEREANYLLALKDNHPILRAEVESVFEMPRQVLVMHRSMYARLRARKNMDGRRCDGLALVPTLMSSQGWVNGRTCAVSSWSNENVLLATKFPPKKSTT
jgi:predicted transposase YbfD/YdcC